LTADLNNALALGIRANPGFHENSGFCGKTSKLFAKSREILNWKIKETTECLTM